jgi:hypothetical protein
VLYSTKWNGTKPLKIEDVDTILDPTKADHSKNCT